jgi:hypothetical protein
MIEITKEIIIGTTIIIINLIPFILKKAEWLSITAIISLIIILLGLLV